MVVYNYPRYPHMLACQKIAYRKIEAVEVYEMIRRWIKFDSPERI